MFCLCVLSALCVEWAWLIVLKAILVPEQPGAGMLVGPYDWRFETGP